MQFVVGVRCPRQIAANYRNPVHMDVIPDFSQYQTIQKLTFTQTPEVECTQNTLLSICDTFCLHHPDDGTQYYIVINKAAVAVV